MDIDHHFKSAAATQEQLDMMMMLQMEKLPDFYGFSNNNSNNNNNDGSTSSGDFLSMGLNMNNIGCCSSMTPLFDTNNPNPNASSSPNTFLNHLSALSFSNANHNIDPSFLNNSSSSSSSSSQKRNSMAAMREMIFRIAAMQPIHIDPESVKPPKRRNVKISKDPQSVAARHRRERISERIRILQRLVPGGTKMDTASMLDEAIHYVKFLKTQVQSLERVQASNLTTNTPTRPSTGIGFPVSMSNGSYLGGNMSNKPYQTSPSYEDN